MDLRIIPYDNFENISSFLAKKNHAEIGTFNLSLITDVYRNVLYMFVVKNFLSLQITEIQELGMINILIFTKFKSIFKSDLFP